MPWGPPQPPAMTNVMADIGALGPFQSVFNMFSSQNHASDQRYAMGGSKPTSQLPLGGVGGEGHVAHSAILTDAERATDIKETVESDSGWFQARSGQVLILSTADSAETPQDENENHEMSENEGSQQTNLFAAMSTAKCGYYI